MRLRFRTQLTLTIALIVFVSAALISVLANTLTGMEFQKYAREQQKTHAAAIAANLSHQYSAAEDEWDVRYIHGVGMSAMYDGYIICLYNLQGGVVWDAENHDMETCNQVMMDIIRLMDEKRPGLSGSFVTQELDLKQNGQKVGSVAIKSYGPYFLSDGDFHFLDSLNLILLIVGVLALLCSLGVGGLMARRISRPVIKTAHIAEQIAEGNYKIRFDGKCATKELDALAGAVNHMAASLDAQEGLRKRLTTDVAHELRTPLTAVASHLEAMLEGLWEITPRRLQGCYEEIGRLSGLVADLEQLARMENENLRLTKADVDLLSLVRTVAGNFESESAKKNLSVSICGAETHINADKDRINQVLTNLFSNAIKYSRENGAIRVIFRESGDNVAVVFEDDGIGIPEKDLPFIFERFYRTDESRARLTGGTGIGLAIAKSIVNAHGGTITAESGGGKGSRFVVTLPKRG